MDILILEDDGFRITTFIEKFYKHNITITEQSKIAIEQLRQKRFDYIFLDHDLGTGNGSGSDVVSFLFKHPYNSNNTSKIIIHSWNIPAVTNMLGKLQYAVHIPFNTVDFFAINIDK